MNDAVVRVTRAGMGDILAAQMKAAKVISI